MEEGWREVAGEGKGGEGGRERMREWREKYFSKVNNVVVLYRAFANVLTFEIFFFFYRGIRRAGQNRKIITVSKIDILYFTLADELTC